MQAATSVPLDLTNPRYWRQNAQAAVRDVYDALVELITNVDDRYEHLRRGGRIDVEIERRRKDTPSVIRVRDFADGMTLDDMRQKLARVGDRVSGLAQGERVRGTNSRGAKDVAILGGVTFESIAQDGHYHKAEITERGRFTPFEPSRKPTAADRKRLGILSGTGTLVTLTVSSTAYSVPKHETLIDQLSRLVPLRDILASQDREVTLTDVNRNQTDRVTAVKIEGEDVLKQRFAIAGYSNAEAKLVIKRASEVLESRPSRFRTSGLLVKSRHAIHGATLFDPSLDFDPYAAYFFGRITCEYIDTLWNEYDDRFDKGLPASAGNPGWAYDPLRQEGMRREHPFTKALYAEALKRLRPLVEEERRRRENAKSRIESRSTRNRLRQLEREATKFMDRYQKNEESSQDDKVTVCGPFTEKGYSLNPPFAQLIVGESRPFSLNINQKVFPELSVAEQVEITCATTEIVASKRFPALEAHPTEDGVLRAVWTVKALKPTRATAVAASVGRVAAETAVEVFSSERERFAHVTALTFDSARYAVRTDATRNLRIFLPIGAKNEPIPIEVECDHRAFKISGDRFLVPKPHLGIAICKLRVSASQAECKGHLLARVAGQEARATILSREPLGSQIQIKIEDVDHKNQRYLWRTNVLEIAARHPSLRRYLGDAPSFPGQEEKHFRILLAEIVADAVCARIIGRNDELTGTDDEDRDWDAYYAEYSKLLTEFLPIAHESQVSLP